jgi:hypothetical protein
MEFDVFWSPLPEVAVDDVVQLVSCFSLDGVVVCATAGPTTNDAAKIVAAMRIIVVSPVVGNRSLKLTGENVPLPRWFPARCQSLTTRTAPRAALVVIDA